MRESIGRWAVLALACTACAALNGCLITNFSGATVGGLTTATATVTLQQQSPCTVDANVPSTTCQPVMTIGQPPASQSFQFLITLLGIGAPITLYDPLIVQVPATMSDFAGSIAAGPPGITPGTPLDIIAGLTTVPIDATTNLVAEPGMQLVIIDFQAPQNAPFGVYTLNFQFRGTASSIKVVFAGKVTVGAAAEAKTEEKAAVTYYPPIFPCVTDFAQVTPINIPVVLAQVVPILLSTPGCVGKQYNLAAAPATIGNVVEFYNAVLDHYFITYIPAEIANLDAGLTPTRWTRTGQTFKVDTTTQAGTSPVCRYYIPPDKGDSHFFGRGTVECTATGTNNPTFILEEPNFMFATLPILGVCPAGTVPVYRVFSNRADANHRYMTDPAVRAQMVGAGWLAEGDGPDLVVMCVRP